MLLNKSPHELSYEKITAKQAYRYKMKKKSEPVKIIC